MCTISRISESTPLALINGAPITQSAGMMAAMGFAPDLSHGRFQCRQRGWVGVRGGHEPALHRHRIPAVGRRGGLIFKGSIAQACPVQVRGLARVARLGAGLRLELGHYLVAEPAQLLEDHVLGRTNY